MSETNRIILITGTDTGVGKTVVGAGLAIALRRQNLRVAAIKPVESGCDTEREASSQEDGVLLAKAAEQETPAQALTRLQAPLAPPAAAKLAKARLDPEKWISAIREYTAAADVALVEGAGGILSPLATGFDARDMATRLEATAVIVVSDRLGCLNHTLLTLEALEKVGVPVEAIVFNAPESGDDSTGGNAEDLQEILPSVSVYEIPRVTGIDEVADCLEDFAKSIAPCPE